MIIQNNNIANKSYVPYLQNLNNLSKSAARLATGEKFASASDGAGDLGVSERLRLEIGGTEAIVSTLTNAIGFSATQDEILGHVSDIANRMYELAASATDPMKSAAERVALNDEFTALSSEVADLAAKSKYNGIELFDNSVTVRVGTEASATVSFASIALSLLTFGSLSVTSVGAASVALSTIGTRVGSLASLRTTARTNNSRIERTMLYTQDYVANLRNAESAIRNIDVAKESATFTTQQVILSASQSILAQANNLPQQVQRFLP